MARRDLGDEDVSKLLGRLSDDGGREGGCQIKEAYYTLFIEPGMG
jgi:hypothetical protein